MNTYQSLDSRTHYRLQKKLEREIQIKDDKLKRKHEKKYASCYLGRV